MLLNNPSAGFDAAFSFFFENIILRAYRLSLKNTASACDCYPQNSEEPFKQLHLPLIYYSCIHNWKKKNADFLTSGESKISEKL